MTTEESNTALVVVGNPIIEGHLKRVLHKRGWSIDVCGDGDSAVDRYVQLRPALVFIALDIPTLDGHVSALEMREADSSARIVFVTSHGRKPIAEDAAYSSGAVGVLVTPITDAQVSEAWGDWHGTIPEAPGLSDLDALYPVLEDPEPPAFPMMPGTPVMPGLPPLPDTTPDDPTNVELPSAATASVVDFTPQKKKSKVRWLVRSTVLFLLTGGALGAAHYLGFVDLNGLIEEFRSTISSLIN
jgi:CheY-like chemotaxis protein